MLYKRWEARQVMWPLFWSLLPQMLFVLGTILVMVIFYRITARIFELGLNQTVMQPGLIRITVRSLYKWSLFTIGLIIVLGMLGINVSAALAGVGVVGIGIGFAAKETLANVMAGFEIFVDKLYKHGDWVTIAEQHGEVKDITLRTTKIRTLDNVFIMIPNSLVTSLPITNYSEEGMIRISVSIGIAFDASLEVARQVLLEAVVKIAGVLKKPAPEVVVDKIGDSAVELLIRVWIADPGKEKVMRFKLLEVSKLALDKAKIEIPFPRQDIYMKPQKVGRVAK